MPAEAPLTPLAARRLSREASIQSFGPAARALNEDWGVQWDMHQVQRWSQALGRSVVVERNRQVLQMEQGHHPPAPANEDQLLVIEVDGGRVQMRDKDEETDSRWREDKVAAISTYLPGDGAEQQPKQLVTTYQATMGDVAQFEPLVRLEAEKRGLRQADQVLVIADGGNWIDPLVERQFRSYVRISDWYHASEHLWDCARAVHGQDQNGTKARARTMENLLWKGKVDKVIEILDEHSRKLGPPQPQDGPAHPRRILAQNVGYFRTHRGHMDYPSYRKRGWPIGSGVVEAGVKQFNKRVKGTDQFWHRPGLEPILALRALWLSQDERWDRYWNARPAYAQAA